MIITLDFFDHFAIIYESLEDKSPENIFKMWNEFYSNNKEEIKNFCLCDYEDEDVFSLFKEHLYPVFKNEWQEFYKAHKSLKTYGEEIKTWFKKKYEIDEDIYFIYFVGIGSGAGAIGKYKNKHAIYFGIEQITKLKWYEKEKMISLIIHELGHIFHFIKREEKNLKYDYPDGDFIWRLYAEGFAERFKQNYKKSDCYIERFGGERIKWFEKNFSKLCVLYYEYMIQGKKEYDFYGDWYNIEGYSESAYYMGTKFIIFIEEKYNLDLTEITYLTKEDMEKYFYEFIKVNSIGLAPGDVFLISAYDFWKDLFEESKLEILEEMESEIVDIQHIGSTSVESLKAKPILDILIGIEKEKKDICISKLQDLNFEYKGEFGIEGREYFLKRKDGKTTHHIHMVEYDSLLWKNHIKFRDVLINDNVMKEKYQQLKEKLSLDKTVSREDYTKLKTSLIKEIMNN